MHKYIKNGSKIDLNVKQHHSVENPEPIRHANQPMPPMVRQPKFVNQRAKFVKHYVFSVYGFVRVIIIVKIFYYF